MTCVNSSHYCIAFHWFSCLVGKQFRGRFTHTISLQQSFLLATDCSGSNCLLNTVQSYDLLRDNGVRVL